MAQLRLAKSTMPIPMGSTAFTPPNGASRTSTPANPAATPPIARPLGRRRLITASKTFIQIGTAATTMAAIPESIRCSERTTNPLPPSSRKPPTIAAERHSRQVTDSMRAAGERDRRLRSQRKPSMRTAAIR